MRLDPFHVGLADSQQVSEYLLESYNDHSRAPRFGAFVLNDTLHVCCLVITPPHDALHVRLLARSNPSPLPNPDPETDPNLNPNPSQP